MSTDPVLLRYCHIHSIESVLTVNGAVSSEIVEDTDINGGDDTDSNGGEDENEDVDTEDEVEKYNMWTYLRNIAITNDK